MSQEVRTSHAELLSDPKFLTITTASYFALFNSTVVSTALPSLRRAFAVSDAQIGLVMSLYTMSGIVFVLLLGVLADIYGRRRMMLVSLLIFGGAGTLIAFVDSFEVLLALRFVQGIGGALVQPLVTALIGDLYEGVRGSTAQGFRASGNGIGMIVMPVIVGYLLVFSWRYVFLLFLFFIFVVVGTYWYLPETGGREHEGTYSLSNLTTHTRQIVRQLTVSKRTILVTGGLIRGFAVFAVLTYLPLYADGPLAATSIAIGIVIAIRGVARIFVAPFTGMLLARFSHRSSMAGGMFVAAVSVFAMPFAPDVVWLGLLMGAFSVGDSIFFPTYMDAIVVTSPADHLAGILSVDSFLFKIGSTISPMLFGIVLAIAGFEPIFISTAALLLAYCCFVVLYVDV